MIVDVAAGDVDLLRVYRLCLGFINPRPIALVSTTSPEGELNLAPFSFYNMVSGRPPVVMFCPALRRDLSRKDTLRNVEQTREFVIAVVTEDIARPMVACGADLPYGRSEFEFSGLTPAPATRVRPRLVREARVNMECGLRDVMFFGETGTGCVVFGDLLALHVDDGVLDAHGFVDPQHLRTVGRLGGKWYCTVSDPFELEIPSADEAQRAREKGTL